MQAPSKQFPYAENGILVVGKVAYVYQSGGSKASGEFLLTRDMLKDLDLLRSKSDALLLKPIY